MSEAPMAVRNVNRRGSTLVAAITAMATVAALLTGCGGGGSNASTPTPPLATSPAGPAAATSAATATAAMPSPSPAPSVAATPSPAASAAVLASCSAGSVAARVSSQGATGSIAIIVALSAPGAPCHFAGPVTVIVEDANGNPQRITGNGVASTVSADVPGSAVFTWSNWCAAQVPFKADVRFADQTLLAALAPPRCADPSAPSMLTLQPAS